MLVHIWQYCHTRTPSWILSYAENLASFSLQDRATEWHYNHWLTHPASQPSVNLPWYSLSVRCVPPLCLSVVAKCLLVFPSGASPLKIWQVPACKMDLIWPTQLGFWVWHSQLSLLLHIPHWNWVNIWSVNVKIQDFRVDGVLLQEIISLCGSIFEVGTCQIFSLAENPRWSFKEVFGSHQVARGPKEPPSPHDYKG